MTHQGSCHCGRIRFEVDGEIASAMACNCSICQRKGVLMWFVPRADLRLATPEADATTYLFNQHRIKHRFCPTCGIHPYGEVEPSPGNLMAAVNIRCIEGIDLDAIPVVHHDGRSA